MLRPAMRGTLHRWAVPVALVLTVLLTVRASGAGDRAAVLVYGLGVTAMLATSGLYHPPASPTATGGCSGGSTTR